MDLKVQSHEQAIEKLEWYTQRWKIEMFHKILKSGDRAEESRLRTADRLVNLLTILGILSWRVFWMTILSRTAPETSPKLGFTSLERKLLDAAVANEIQRRKNFAAYLNKLARLGGYLSRSHGPPPGNQVVRCGLGRLTDMALGALLCAKLVK